MDREWRERERERAWEWNFAPFSQNGGSENRGSEKEAKEEGIFP
jgi:hypothetical protein